MQIVFFILIGVFCLVVWSMVNEQRLKKRMLEKLKEQWGMPPTEDISSDKYESLKAYYRSVMDDRMDIDDITWNDLDMDEIYLLMNNTQCSIGEEYLYSLLRKPSFSKEELEERNRLMKYFSEHEEQRILVQSKLHPIGKFSRITIFDFISRLDEQVPRNNLEHYIMVIGLIAAIVFIFINPSLGGIITVIMVVNNIIQYYRKKAEIENFLAVFAFICRLLDGMKEIYQLQIPDIQTYTFALKEDCDKFKSFQRGSFFLTPKKNNGNLIDLFLDYTRMLFHIDLIKYNSMLNHFKKNRDVFNHIFVNVGFLDSMIAAASFRKMLYYYCEPVLEKGKKPYMNVKELYHPLIPEPVPNSISENRSVLITGSNASGKSTFIKTLAINALLAQTIYTSTCKSYKASYFMIYSSMALRDNIFNKESYYMVEIKSLKRILDRVNDEIPTLCFIDEVLRGTNTLERIAASSRILSHLAKKNALVFAATHDIELTQILEADYSNYHFQERIEANEILFDYKLYQGKAISKNAIKLLDMLKFPKEITTAAENAAEDFLMKGEWSKI
ncbi:MAG TPA: hypothetical protein VN258_12060 [Mobilitalea sp.]|nr:hypothetical protein [Mobilitalea sp.]